jgi:hypothetical protein
VVVKYNIEPFPELAEKTTSEIILSSNLKYDAEFKRTDLKRPPEDKEEEYVFLILLNVELVISNEKE